MAMDLRTLGPDRLAPGRRAPLHTGTKHFVQFYDEDAVLIDAITTFMASGILLGETAVVVATASHRDALTESLSAVGIDLDAERAAGRYLEFDAAEILDRFMVKGHPDPDRFTNVIGEILRHASSGGRNVRAFGEMVALLWAGGNTSGAVALEELWNLIAEAYRFQLFCAYPATEMNEQQMAEIAEVCSEHSHVFPPV
jgi:MEDS: MEthanogen/methylotroph, DcmR Sensory domain